MSTVFAPGDRVRIIDGDEQTYLVTEVHPETKFLVVDYNTHVHVGMCQLLGVPLIPITAKRKSILLHAYNEMRGEAFEWERKGDVLSAQECWNDCEEFKFMLIEAGIDDAALNFASNTLA